ncbi:hypothetical protein EIK77_008270 [Talaromyces pinophilus]|nr:hypothetical protein EIK77_008270 [Talaromyces pinophilus]
MSNDQQNPDVETLSKNQIWFKVDNKTAFELTAESGFADWGDVAEPPSTVGNLPTSRGFSLTLFKRLGLIVRALVGMLSALIAHLLARLEWGAIES